MVTETQTTQTNEPVVPNMETNTSKKEGATFTSEQQDVINKLINQKYKEAYDKAEAKYKSLLEEKAAVEEKKVEAKGKKGTTEEVDVNIKTLNDKLAEAQKVIELNELNAKMFQEKQQQLTVELEKERQERLLERKRNLLLSSANKAGFIDPQIVQRLVEDRFVYDEQNKSFKIFNEQGQERWNKNLQPLSVDEFFEEYAQTHPYMVKGSNMSGSGAIEGNLAKNKKMWKRSEISSLSPADYEKHRVDILSAQKEGRISE